MRWREYPRYKPSGVEWLGEVPDNWPVMRLRFRAKINPSKAEINSMPGGTTVSFVPMEMVGEYGGLRLDEMKMLDEVANGYTYFREGDVVVAKITPCFENWKGSVAKGLENGLGFGTTELHVIRPADDLDRRYLFYLTITHAFRSIGTSYMYGAGGQKRVPDDFVRNFRHPFPPINDQRAIAAFLDREMGRIDTLIEKKQRQIELLQEKRTALISHIVTKGLDPNVKMKDSGVEWLGHVPGHWELKRLKFVAKIQTGLTLGKDYKDVPTISRPYLRVANVQDGYLDLNDITDILIQEEDTNRHELKQGDVLMTEGGDFDKLGRGYVWEGQIDGCLHQNHIFAVRPNPKYLASRYLAMLMTSSYGKAYFTSTSQQTTNLATTNITKLKNILLPLPDIQEQYLILDWLGGNISKIDGLIAKVHESIDKLKECRTAIISAAVTGKIDVRGEVRKSPAAFPRIVLGAEIMDRLHNDPNFHRVKFQKVLYLCEHYLGMDLEGNYWRQAAGPLDNRMLYSLENRIQHQKWFATRRDGQKVTYVPMEKADGHRKYFDDYWADYREGLDSLLELMRPLNTRQSEIVATLFAAWNDLIIADLPFTDEDILHEVRSNWHESKERFDEDRLRRALRWMRDKGLIPRGLGKATKTGHDTHRGEEA